jgi:hypothetical protein|nr:MAG TPA: hypothetical protein [Caudoviricetes sp.]
MKLKTPYKTVMFYGNILRINARANWVAVNEDGTMSAFMEKPFANYGVWDVKSGAIWNLDARMELEGEDWKDTLAYCSQDQQWMITAVSHLDIANFLYSNDATHTASCRTVDFVVDTIRRKVADWNLRGTFNALMKHAAPSYLRASPVTEMLRDKLFPKQKIKDYYGADVVVPSWTSWIAMNRNGSVMAFEMRPGISPGHFWEYGTQDKRGQMIQVAWRDDATSEENWRDSLREV